MFIKKIFSGTHKKGNWGFLAQLQKIGKALLFPIAILPFAAILLRVGAQVPTDTAFSAFVQFLIINGGSFVFSNLFMFFAIGVAFGLAKDQRGEAAIVAFLLMTMATLFLSKGGLIDRIYGNLNLGAQIVENGVTKAVGGFERIPALAAKFDDIMAKNVLNGIIVGIIVASIYNRFRTIELPKILSFFSGRRLIPVLAIIFGWAFTLLWAIIFPWVALLLVVFGKALVSATGNRYSNAAISDVFGIINRSLIPFGLHHIPNTLFWFQFGEFPAANATLENPNVVNGDIFIFLSGATNAIQSANGQLLPNINNLATGTQSAQGLVIANSSGAFQSGFFPIMMFGLPAIVAAFIYNADNREQRIRVGAYLISPALVSFFTGITEPIEFAFLFVSPLLFGIHALLTGIFSFIVGLFGIQIGFGFSAGLFDYLLSFPKSLALVAANKTGADAVFANPFWILAIGALAAFTYFSIFTFLTKKLKLATPGRGVNRLSATEEKLTSSKDDLNDKYTQLSEALLNSLGGFSNLLEIDNCATRLRLLISDQEKVDEATLRKIPGVRGFIVIGQDKNGNTNVHVIIGTHVEIVRNSFEAVVQRQKGN